MIQRVRSRISFHLDGIRSLFSMRDREKSIRYSEEILFRSLSMLPQLTQILLIVKLVEIDREESSQILLKSIGIFMTLPTISLVFFRTILCNISVLSWTGIVAGQRSSVISHHSDTITASKTSKKSSISVSLPRYHS